MARLVSETKRILLGLYSVSRANCDFQPASLHHLVKPGRSGEGCYSGPKAVRSKRHIEEKTQFPLFFFGSPGLQREIKDENQ